MDDKRSLLGIVLILCLPAAGLAGRSTTAADGSKQLHLIFTERSPLSTLDVVLPRFDPNRSSQKPTDAARASLEYDLAKESFEAFIPSTYQSDVPHGLFVWISAGNAEVPPGWLDVFRRHKLIWVSANNSGNQRYAPIRMGLALDAVYNMRKRYNIDDNRVYVSGFSGGAGVASFLLRGFPSTFDGGYLLMGYLFHNGHTSDKGRWEAETPRGTWDGPLDQIKRDMRLVILDGEGDPTAPPGARRADSQALVRDGFQHVTFFEVPGLGHRLPDAIWFEKGIVALEARSGTSLVSSPVPDVRTGRQRLTFTERNPLSAMDTILQRMDMTNLAADSRKVLEYDLSNLSFKAFLPAGYRSDVPHGLLIWTGVADFSPDRSSRRG